MHSAGLLPLALEGLEVVETTLAGDLALELLEPVEGHTCGIRPEQHGRKVSGGPGRGVRTVDALVVVKYLAGLLEVEDFPVGVVLEGI